MNTLLYPLFGTLFTFLMTTLGSALVFFFKDEVKSFYQQLFLGFAAGIMIAASVWSLLIPSMEMAEANGQNSALILGGGFIIGALFLLFLDHVIPHQHLNEDKPEGPKSMLGKNTMLVLAVTLHNIPEGFAVGLTFAIAASNSSITLASAFALALGIGLQNLPEGAAISLQNKEECHVQKLLFMEAFQELLNRLQESLPVLRYILCKRFYPFVYPLQLER